MLFYIFIYIFAQCFTKQICSLPEDIMTEGDELVTEENTDDAAEANTADADTAADMMTGFD